MSEFVATAPTVMPSRALSHTRKKRSGKIKISAKSRSATVIKYTVITLLALTVYGFLTFDYKNIDVVEAVVGTVRNAGVMFGRPALTYGTITKSLQALGITVSLGVLSTFTGAIIAFFGALLCARNIAHPAVSNVVKGFVAFIRAVPTILWVLIFTVAAGLGSVAAVLGLTFHSAGYLIKAYSEAIEEMDIGSIEALKAHGASFWQIVFQAIVPASITYFVAWTFLRFEINFANAIAVGAAAGAGGIGYNLFMAGTFYFDLPELGFYTYVVVIAVIIFETIATRIKATVK